MGTKKPSAFNEFMKVTIPQIKQKNPKMKHTEAFSMAAAQWKTSSLNPKKQ